MRPRRAAASHRNRVAGRKAQTVSPGRTETGSTGVAFGTCATRHDLEAIVAYGAYRRSLFAGQTASEAAHATSDAISSVADSNDVAVS
jgi:hypothetical protein